MTFIDKAKEVVRKLNPNEPEKGTIGYALKYGNRAERRSAQAQLNRLNRKKEKAYQRAVRNSK